MVDPVLFARGLHGHVGVLAFVALLHPAVSPRARWSRWVATALVTVAVVMGWGLYPRYRDVDKPQLLHHAPPLASLFETKEHLAFYALALAWAGLALSVGVRDPRAPPAARRCYLLAAGLTGVAGGMGAVIGSWAKA